MQIIDENYLHPFKNPILEFLEHVLCLLIKNVFLD